VTSIAIFLLIWIVPAILLLLYGLTVIARERIRRGQLRSPGRIVHDEQADEASKASCGRRVKGDVTSSTE
jgi:cytochrome c-type biogenesis protein CcmH/NrfF